MRTRHRLYGHVRSHLLSPHVFGQLQCNKDWACIPSYHKRSQAITIQHVLRHLLSAMLLCVFLNHRLCTLESPFLVLQVTHAVPGRRSRATPNTITPVDSPQHVDKLLGAYVASSPQHDCPHEAAELAQLVGTSKRMHAKYSKI